jgi:hypothetical protein
MKMRLREAGGDAFSKDSIPVRGDISAYRWARINGLDDEMDLVEKLPSIRAMSL